MSYQHSSPQRSRREFLIRSAASLVGGSFVLGLGSQSLLALHPAIGARETALGFLSTLSREQKALAQIPFEDNQRVQWHFIPMESRKGLPLRAMSETQRTAAFGVLASILSETGFRRAVDIMAYEAILLELEGPSAASRRDYQKFYMTLYGNPAEKELWGVSIEGHHLSINMTFLGDTIVDSTPQFFGVNPAKLRREFTTPDPLQSGAKIPFKAGTRLLLPEEDAAVALMQSLSDAQRAEAVYAAECPEDIQWAGQAQPVVEEPVGIAAKDLNAAQQKQLEAILQAYFSTMPESVAKDRWQGISQGGLDAIHFGWAGGTQSTDQHFFRITGPSFIAELCNYQTDPEGNRANHIHSVWRDLTGDFNLPLSS